MDLRVGMRTGFDERSFEHVREERKYRVQRRKVFLLADFAIFNTSQEFGENGQIQDQRSGKKRVLKIV
jgi:hypothetical protein